VRLVGCNNINKIDSKRMLSSMRVPDNKNYNVSDLIQSVKGNFSYKLNIGNIWQRRFYTRIVDSNRYLGIVIDYIKHNPIKAELPKKYRKFPYQYFNWGLINRL
jgi:REP element-mobilizing transposase RayT